MPISTRELSKIAGVAEQTVRNWTRDYSELFSPAARGENGARLFSDEDVQVFCSIATLRKDGVPPHEVTARLQRGDVYIEATTDHTNATPTEPQTTPTALDAPYALILVRQDLQRQINDIKRNQRLLLRGALLWGMVLGAIGALAVAGFFMWALYLFGG